MVLIVIYRHAHVLFIQMCFGQLLVLLDLVTAGIIPADEATFTIIFSIRWFQNYKTIFQLLFRKKNSIIIKIVNKSNKYTKTTHLK